MFDRIQSGGAPVVSSLNFNLQIEEGLCLFQQPAKRDRDLHFASIR